MAKIAHQFFFRIFIISFYLQCMCMYAKYITKYKCCCIYIYIFFKSKPFLFNIIYTIFCRLLLLFSFFAVEIVVG